jgi:predicted GNAT family acetyltransferase
VLRTSSARVLDARDLTEVRALLQRDPVTDVFVGSRLETGGLEPWRLGAELWGFGDRGRLESLCYSGPNLVPVQCTTDAAKAFAERARRQGRRCSSIVGPASVVEQIWAGLATHWSPPREARMRQPLLAIDRSPDVTADPEVRLVRPEELDILLPACIQMFTEEVGVSPLAQDGGAMYRARVEELINQNLAWARIQDGRVLFKAEVGCATAQACQVQGVWVHPSQRGLGIGTAGMAAVVEQARTSVSPVVSLYVNDFNTQARKAYEKVGFREIGTFASILF